MLRLQIIVQKKKATDIHYVVFMIAKVSEFPQFERVPYFLQSKLYLSGSFIKEVSSLLAIYASLSF